MKAIEMLRILNRSIEQGRKERGAKGWAEKKEDEKDASDPSKGARSGTLGATADLIVRKGDTQGNAAEQKSKTVARTLESAAKGKADLAAEINQRPSAFGDKASTKVKGVFVARNQHVRSKQKIIENKI